MTALTIVLSPTQISVIASVLNEFGGGSSDDMCRMTGQSPDSAWEIRNLFEDRAGEGDNRVTMDETDWIIIYHSINASIYALGPFELETLFPANFLEVLQTNQVICSELWGVYQGLTWTERYRVERK